jgi:hypothetical protein
MQGPKPTSLKLPEKQESPVDKRKSILLQSELIGKLPRHMQRALAVSSAREGHINLALHITY